MRSQARGTGRGTGWLDEKTAATITIQDFDKLKIPKSLRSIGWTSEQLFSMWNKRNEIALEQVTMEITNTDVDSLAYALENLPSLAAVRLLGGGVGGYRKLYINGTQKAFLENNALNRTRADGRQLSSFFNAAAAVSSSSATSLAAITTFVLDKDFWKPGPYTYSG